jgi:hypothetical protein
VQHGRFDHRFSPLASNRVRSFSVAGYGRILTAFAFDQKPSRRS